jgi:hypothetical protein
VAATPVIMPVMFTDAANLPIRYSQESCNINDHGNEALHKRLYNFEKVSAGLLIEYNIFFGGSVLTKRRPAWFDVRRHSSFIMLVFFSIMACNCFRASLYHCLDYVNR